MITFLPKQISTKAITIYLISLACVSVVFFRYAMPLEYILMGIVFVIGFFLLTANYSFLWMNSSRHRFIKRVFWWAFGLRVAWVIISYFFYTVKTGVPFEFESADAIGYHDMGRWLMNEPWSAVWDILFEGKGVSDTGYILYITFLYKIFGPNIILTRLLKAIYSAITCVLIYKLSARVLGEKAGRMAGVFAVFMPNLIIYCGLHLKETEMLFLTVAFLERADAALRSKKLDVWDVLFALLLGGSLFFFRTVLGAVALFAFATALLFSPGRVIRKGRKFFIGLWVVLGIIVLAGGSIKTEVEGLLEGRETNQSTKREEQTLRGNQWAQYATGAVMAPMMFVMPFSTMVDTDQYNQCVLHGGNYVRNFMGIFVLIALYVAIFKKKTWRDFSLVGAFVIGYLGVLALSGFANSERFLLPALPGLIVMWAYGLSELDKRSFNYVGYWCYFVLAMECGWAFFKIGSRGLF